MSDGDCVKAVVLLAYGILAGSYFVAAVALGPVLGPLALTTVALFAKVVLGLGTAYILVGGLGCWCFEKFCNPQGNDDYLLGSGVVLGTGGLFAVPIAAAAVVNACEAAAMTYGTALIISFTGLGVMIASGLVICGISFGVYHICQRA